MISEASNFPNEIDPMTFFQDVDLDHKDEMDKYYSLVAKGEFDNAESFLLETNGLHGYFAQLFNAFENRISAVQEFLLSQEEETPTQQKPESPFQYTDTEPTSITDSTIWI